MYIEEFIVLDMTIIVYAYTRSCAEITFWGPDNFIQILFFIFFGKLYYYILFIRNKYYNIIQERLCPVFVFILVCSAIYLVLGILLNFLSPFHSVHQTCHSDDTHSVTIILSITDNR